MVAVIESYTVSKFRSKEKQNKNGGGGSGGGGILTPDTQRTIFLILGLLYAHCKLEGPSLSKVNKHEARERESENRRRMAQYRSQSIRSQLYHQYY